MHKYVQVHIDDPPMLNQVLFTTLYVTHMINYSRPSTALLQAMENWAGPGNEATAFLCVMDVCIPENDEAHNYASFTHQLRTNTAILVA